MSWGELVRRTVRETIDDDCLGLAAQVSYYLFLALFPAILFLLAVASFFPIENLTDEIGRLLGPIVSAEVLQLIQDQMQRLANSESGGLLTFSVAGALWSSSAGVVSIVSALNRAYEIEETRPWWKVRLVSLGLTLGMAALILMALALVVVGPQLATYLGDVTGWGSTFKWAWLLAQWPLILLMASTAIGLAYYFGPDAEQEWVWITPGATLATLLWLLMSLAFRYYVTTFADYNASYGSVGGVIVLMLWFYITGLAILVGAEMNSEIEHAAPYGKAVGQQAKAGRRLLGRRAAAQFDEQQRMAPPAAPVAAPLVPPRHPSPMPGAALALGVLPLRMWKRWRSAKTSATEAVNLQ